jgi:hypothetical protein
VPVPVPVVVVPVVPLVPVVPVVLAFEALAFALLAFVVFVLFEPHALRKRVVVSKIRRARVRRIKFPSRACFVEYLVMASKVKSE